MFKNEEEQRNKDFEENALDKRAAKKEESLGIGDFEQEEPMRPESDDYEESGLRDEIEEKARHFLQQEPSASTYMEKPPAGFYVNEGGRFARVKRDYVVGGPSEKEEATLYGEGGERRARRSRRSAAAKAGGLLGGKHSGRSTKEKEPLEEKPSMVRKGQTAKEGQRSEQGATTEENQVAPLEKPMGTQRPTAEGQPTAEEYPTVEGQPTAEEQPTVEESPSSKDGDKSYYDYYGGEETDEEYFPSTGFHKVDSHGAHGKKTSADFEEEEYEEEATMVGTPEVVSMPRKKKKRRQHNYFLKFIIACVAIALLLAFLKSPFFDVKKISVEGADFLTEEQVIQLSGLAPGGNIFGTDTGAAEEALESHPYVRKADVHRNLPRTLIIELTEYKPMAYLEKDKKFYTINSAGRVLAVGDKAPDNHICVTGLTVKTAEPGGQMEVKKEDMQKWNATVDLLAAMEQSGISFVSLVIDEDTATAYFSDKLLVTGPMDNVQEALQSGNLQLILDDLKEREITEGSILIGKGRYYTYSPETK